MIYLKQGVNGDGLKKILGIKNQVIKKPKRTKDYLHPQWKSLRAKVLRRDNYKCLTCGSNKQLCCHHNYYIEGNQLWEYPLNAFQTLCKDCHDAFHKITPGRDMVRKTGNKKIRKVKPKKKETKHSRLKKKENKFLSRFKV